MNSRRCFAFDCMIGAVAGLSLKSCDCKELIFVVMIGKRNGFKCAFFESFMIQKISNYIVVTHLTLNNRRFLRWSIKETRNLYCTYFFILQFFFLKAVSLLLKRNYSFSEPALLETKCMLIPSR